MNVKKDLENAKEAVKTISIIRLKMQKYSSKCENNVNTIVENQKAKAEAAKKDFAQTKADLEKAKENRAQSQENLKNLFNNALKNSQHKVNTSTPEKATTSTSAEATTKE